MACGALEISHDTFRALPSDRAHDYLRSLLVAVGVLSPIDIRIERMLPWIEHALAGQSTGDAALIRQFAHWHLLRQMRKAARERRLTKSMSDACRRRIRVAINFLAFLDSRDATVETASQELLERYQEHVRRPLTHEYAFLVWLRQSRINTTLTITDAARSPPAVTVSDSQRWAAAERLLHDNTIRRYTRIAGLLTLLFAQPLSRIVALRTSQVTITDNRAVHITFGRTPIQMPPLLDDLIREHLKHRGKSLHASRDNGWLFPGGNPGSHLAAENIRSQLVTIGVNPTKTARLPSTNSPATCPHRYWPSSSGSPIRTPPRGPPNSLPRIGPTISLNEPDRRPIGKTLSDAGTSECAAALTGSTPIGGSPCSRQFWIGSRRDFVASSRRGALER